jgi:predicted ribosome quality control (RQC) complex YloA/Tae2 family protein
MFFDALTMACVADQLRGTILGGRIQQALLPGPRAVGLEIYAGRQRHYLYASAHAEQCRVHLSSKKLRRGVDKETGLLLLLRKQARGAVIARIEQPPYERILRLGLDHPEWGSVDLFVEVMGRHSNIILVGAAGRILDAAKRVGPNLSPARPVLPGQPYQPPPPQAKLPPSALTEYRLRQMLATAEPDSQVWQVLVRGLRGISPLLGREISHRTLGHPRATVDRVERLTPLLEAVAELLSPLQTQSWHPSVAVHEGQAVVYAPYLLTHRGEPEPVPTISEAIERYAASVASVDPYASAKRSVQETIASARARMERRRDAVEQSLAQASEATRLQESGQWILAYAHTVVPGQTSLQADTGDGETLTITLDPGKTAAENAQAYFRRYRKGQRAAKGLPAQLQETRLALRNLEQLETDLSLASSRPEIEEVRLALAAAGFTRSKGRRSRRIGPMPKATPLSLTSPDGFSILVGRNSRQNDEVTFRQGTGDDWWFHARGVPGAHVIVRAESRQLPPDTIQMAAELAAYYSQLRSESSVDVDYTLRRHVRRIPRAAPGLVTYRWEQTIRVAPRAPHEDSD